jgi:hypothetical protein
MCLRRVPEKYIAGAALDRAGVETVGYSTSQNPTGFHGQLQEELYFTILVCNRKRSLSYMMPRARPQLCAPNFHVIRIFCPNILCY